MCDRLDRSRFDWQVCIVSATGFFTDSYALFATNVILPSLAYLYWPDTTSGKPELTINCITLFGSLCGQLLFGILADIYGRRRLYGLELVIVIFGTLGMAQASTGLNHSMDIMGWIIFWRFFMGLGIGAEYPLSAVISAEFAGVNSRARMMAIVFLMQPLGQAIAAAVGWGALVSIGKARGVDLLPPDGNKLDEKQKFVVISTIDTIWRCVVGVGAFPAILAIIYRLSIPESPRYTLDVILDGEQALSDVIKYQDQAAGTDAPTAASIIGGLGEAAPTGPDMNIQETPQHHAQLSAHLVVQPQAHLIATQEQPRQQPVQDLGQNPGPQPVQLQTAHTATLPNYFTKRELYNYLIRDGNIRYLFATSTCWFLLDFAFYGLGINNPRQIAAIWESSNHTDVAGWPSPSGSPYATFVNGTFPDWENPFDPDSNMYNRAL